MTIESIHPLLLFTGGWLIGMGGMGLLFIMIFPLLRRRGELLLHNEKEGITPRFTYDEKTQQIFFLVEDNSVTENDGTCGNGKQKQC